VADDVAYALFEMGASGVEENLPFKQEGSHYEPEILIPQNTSLRAYFTAKPDMLIFKSEFPNLNYELSEEQNKDWLSEWKKGFNAFELAANIWIVPSWLTPPKEAQRVIRIDPGMAFGTGTHETTKLMAQLITQYSKGEAFLDVGTGTGVLAILAEILGFKNVQATEIDPEARRTARENVAINKSQVVILDEQIESISSQFDIVAANIIDGVLVELAGDLKRVLKDGGYLIVSGILTEREDNFLKQFDQAGLKFLKREELGEWVALVWEKR
jgi:ribosomal protein L11 methyltransferase